MDKRIENKMGSFLMLTLALALPVLSFAGGWDRSLADFPSGGDDAARIQRAVDALPLGTLYVPRGEYAIARTIHVTNNCSLVLNKGAVLRAAAALPYVMRIDCDKAKSDRSCFVEGGQIDGDGRASCAYIANFAHYTMRDVTFLNGLKYGLHVVGGYELIANNLYFKCTKNGMAGNAGLFVQGGDSHYTDCVAVDWTVGFRIQGGANRLTRCHTWGGPVPPAKKGEPPEMLKDSINFWIDTGCSTILRDCYADSGKIGFLVDGWGDGDTRLLGCSYFNNKFFGLDDITVIKHVHGRLLVTDGSITKSAPHMKVYEGSCPVVWQNMLYSGFGKDDDCPGAILRDCGNPASLKLASD